MKTDFSSSWNNSVQPRKQRKYTYNAPLHIRHKFLSAHLSRILRQKYGKRSLPLRNGDEVLVMRGSFKKKKVKITGINLKAQKVFLESLQRTKKDGTKVNIPFHPSNLQLVAINSDDKERSNALGRTKNTSHKQVKEKKNVSN